MKEFKPAEAYSNEEETILLVRTKGGGFNSYVSADSASVNGERLADISTIASLIIDLKIQVLESKR